MNLMTVMMASGYGPFGNVSTMAAQTANGTKSEDAITEGIDQALGKDAFLRLLTTQLRYQDPMRPVEDQDFIAQMAQFSALEEMQNLAWAMETFIAQERATNQMARAAGLLGRVVEVQGETGVHTGMVEAIKMLEGVPRLVVDGTMYEVGDVRQVIVDEES